MEGTLETPKAKRQKIEMRPLNQDLIEQCPNFGSRSKRTTQLNPVAKKLEDKQRNLGDVWTPQRGYDMFIYHYRKKYTHKPVSNPWRMKTCNVKCVYQCKTNQGTS